MKKLLQGILEFRRYVYPAYRGMFARLAGAQTPDCLFIACSDSRLVPNLVSSTQPGDLFVLRNVGNLIPAWAIILAALAQVERDGALVVAAAASSVVATGWVWFLLDVGLVILDRIFG